jgi:hypothetical protein
MNWGLSLYEKPTRRTTLAFIVLSCVGMLIVFRAALWGEAILAPLDIPPTLFSKYKWVDPALGKIPKNHYVVDMFDYDLSRTHVAHRSLAQGEFPWWDPYSGGGAPLAAETHFGISDPIKLTIFRLFSFVTAYNWTRVIQSFLGGLGMFLLLGRLGFAQFTTVLGALSFQFSAPQAGFYFTIPIHSWYYYPFLWLVLHEYGRTRPALAAGLGGLLCAAMFMAGTQQSHIYVALFLFCLATGYGSFLRSDLIKLLLVAGGAFLLGCALAAPFLVPQTELFALSDRRAPPAASVRHLFTGIFSIAGLFPWFTGSFRTLDLSKLLGQQCAAYVVYIGTAAMILALIGLLGRKKLPPHRRPQTRAAFLLVFTYFVVICSTPLIGLLYIRSSILATLALTVLLATGWEILIAGTWPGAVRIARAIVLLLSVGIVLTHLFAFALYPRIKDKVLNVVLEQDVSNISMPSVPDLRRFQVANMPNEITFKNPEALLAYLGALCLLGLASANTQQRRVFAVGVFGLNLLPLLIFAQRATPYSPIHRWNALVEAGPEQKALIKLLGRDLRMTESAPTRLDFVFPGTTAALYGVHSLHGWASMTLAGPGQKGSRREYNVSYTTAPGSETGEITFLHTNQTRFVWRDMLDRGVTITRETPNSIELRIAAGSTGELVRTDTYYPGWRVESPKGIAQRRNGDGFWAFSIPTDATNLILRYRPSYSQATALICIGGLAATAGLLLLGIRSRPANQTAQVRPP